MRKRCQVRPRVLDQALASYPDETPAQPTLKKGQAAKKGHDAVARMQEYAGGQLDDVLAEIRQKGFDIGCSLNLVDSSSVDSSQLPLSVKDAVGGVVTVFNAQTKLSSEWKVSDFFEKFKLAGQEEEVTLFPGWPADYMVQKGYAIHLMKLRILHAMHCAAASAQSDFDLVDLYEKPKRTVRAKENIAKGGLLLVPNTTKVLTKLAQEQAWDGELCVSTPSSGPFACLEGIRFVLGPNFSKEMPCVAWAVKSTDKQNLANMGWSRMKITDVGVGEGPPERTKAIGASKPKEAKAKASASSAASASCGSLSDFSLEVPVLINTKALAKSAELLFFAPQTKQKRDEGPAPVRLSKIMRTK